MRAVLRGNALAADRRTPRRPANVATISTIYFALYLCAGSVIAITRSSQHFNLFIFLIWFFPLLVFNKLVNAPVVGRFLAKFLLLAPIAIVCLYFVRLTAIFTLELVFFIVAYCLSYLAFGLTFNIVTRYREEFGAERERAESLKVESGVLESISDCFISLDSAFRLVYLNDAACAEFGIDRRAALRSTLCEAVPGFFAESVFADLQTAQTKAAASVFETENRKQDRWYEMRCFPRPDGLSVYFRNISDRRLVDAKIQHLAFYDALTGLPNRLLLRQRLGEAIESPACGARVGALLFINIDDLKHLTTRWATISAICYSRTLQCG